MLPRSSPERARTATARFPSRGRRPRAGTALVAACARGSYSRSFRCANRKQPGSLDLQGLFGFGDVIGLGIGDVHDHRLHRSQPGREQWPAWCSIRMPMKRSIEPTMARCSMTGMALLAGFVHIFGAEAARHHEIDLHGAELPGAADRVLQVVLDLRAVERALARQFLPFNAQARSARAARPRPCPRWHRHRGAIPGAARS
jgi:hypothetical protein